jgi:predicted RNA-binding protein
MKFNFSFGRNKKTVLEWAKISIILETLIEFLSKWLKIDKKNLWNLVDEIQRELLKRGWIEDTINDYVINTPELLDQRIGRDVDKAILEYEKVEAPLPINMKNGTILKEIEKDEYSETQKKIVEDAIYYEKAPDGSKAQDILGGEMGIRSPWVEK